MLAIWQHLGRFLAIFSQCMHRNGYFSWHLLGRMANLWDHNDPVYSVNSCFTQIFDRTKIILFVTIFPWRCTEFLENSMSFPVCCYNIHILGWNLMPGESLAAESASHWCGHQGRERERQGDVSQTLQLMHSLFIQDDHQSQWTIVVINIKAMLQWCTS